MRRYCFSILFGSWSVWDIRDPRIVIIISFRFWILDFGDDVQIHHLFTRRRCVKRHIFEYLMSNRMEKDNNFQSLPAHVQHECSCSSASTLCNIASDRQHHQSISKKSANTSLYLVPLNDFVINDHFILCRLRIAIKFGSDGCRCRDPSIHTFSVFGKFAFCSADIRSFQVPKRHYHRRTPRNRWGLRTEDVRQA